MQIRIALGPELAYTSVQATRLSVKKLPPHTGSLDPKGGSTLVNVTVGCLCLYESMSTAGVWCPILEPTSAVRRSTRGTDSGLLLPSARSSSKDSARVVLNPRDGGVNMQFTLGLGLGLGLGLLLGLGFQLVGPLFRRTKDFFFLTNQ